MSILNLISALGIVALCYIAWLGSEDRRNIPWHTIFWGIVLQLIVSAIVFVFGSQVVAWVNDLLNIVLEASEAGAKFLFGGASSMIAVSPKFGVGPGDAGRWIARAVGDPYVAIPGDRLPPNNLDIGTTYILAFRALPQIIFFSGLVSLLYRLNVIPPIIRLFAKLFQNTMRISGAEALAGAANIFVGIESAIAVKPFLRSMSRSEICAVLACCFGSIASSVLAIYAGLLRPTFPTITGHLVSASILTIPACFVLSKLLVPETTIPLTLGHIPHDHDNDPQAANSQSRPSPIDSLITGSTDGVKMAAGIAAVLIAVLGIVDLFNRCFGLLGTLPAIGGFFQIITLPNLLGMLFLPLTFLTGVSLDWSELWQTSILIGRRLVETSIPPYLELGQLAAAGVISDRALLIVSYVLCGFTHCASYGIFVGGLSALVPDRRADIVALGIKALWAGTLATLMTGCMAGLFYWGNATSILGLPAMP